MHIVNIYTKDLQKGAKQLEKLYNSIPKDHEIRFQGRYGFYDETANTQYKVFNISASPRAYRFDECYIDESITAEEIETIIEPMRKPTTFYFN